MNVDTIRTDIPTSSTVTDVLVWNIEQSGTDTFSATYEVDQQIKEGEQTSNVKATYTVKVHVDADGDMVIVQNPTLVSYIQFRAVPAIQNNTISNYGTEITIVSLGICAYIILVAMIAVIRGFKYSKK